MTTIVTVVVVLVILLLSAMPKCPWKLSCGSKIVLERRSPCTSLIQYPGVLAHLTTTHHINNILHSEQNHILDPDPDLLNHTMTLLRSVRFDGFDDDEAFFGEEEFEGEWAHGCGPDCEHEPIVFERCL